MFDVYVWKIVGTIGTVYTISDKTVFEEFWSRNHYKMAGSVDRMMQSMLKHSDAERAFMPWTQELEDKLLYSLMILGKTSFIGVEWKTIQ